MLTYFTRAIYYIERGVSLFILYYMKCEYFFYLLMS